MNNFIINYVSNLNESDIFNFLISKDIYLSKEELEFVTKYLKSNIKELLSNIKKLDIKKYQGVLKETNIIKLNNLKDEMLTKYGHLL